jgi:hypothetical protein
MVQPNSSLVWSVDFVHTLLVFHHSVGLWMNDEYWLSMNIKLVYISNAYPFSKHLTTMFLSLLAFTGEHFVVHIHAEWLGCIGLRMYRRDYQRLSLVCGT